MDEAASFAPQVLVEIVKSLAFAPEIVILRMVIAEVPTFLSVTVCGSEVDSIETLPKERVWGVTSTPDDERQPVCSQAHNMRNVLRSSAAVLLVFRLRLGLQTGEWIADDTVGAELEGWKSTRRDAAADAWRRESLTRFILPPHDLHRDIVLLCCGIKMRNGVGVVAGRRQIADAKLLFGGRQGAYAFFFKLTLAVVPLPGVLLSSMAPPAFSTIALQIARPSPAPPVERVREGSPR